MQRYYIFRSSVLPSVRASQKFVKLNFGNCKGQFYQICNFSEVEDKGELIQFWGQKVKG